MVMGVERWLENRNLYIGASLVLHLLLLFYLKTSKTSITTPAVSFREVSYIEESPRARFRNPKVKKLLESSSATPSSKPSPPSPAPESKVPEPKLDISTPKLDLSPSVKPDLTPSTKPEIELSSGLSDAGVGVQINGGDIDLSTGLEGADVVISSGKATGTEEILSRPEVKPSIELSSGMGDRGLPSGNAGAGGGEPGISLEPVGGPSVETSSPPTVPSPPPPSNILENPSSASKKPSMQISGQIANRKIVQRVRPLYPARALREGREGTVQVKFWVAPNGRVRPNVIVVRSSGSPDLDQAVIQAIRQWRFAPLPVEEDQWGVLTVVFRLL